MPSWEKSKTKIQKRMISKVSPTTSLSIQKIGSFLKRKTDTLHLEMGMLTPQSAEVEEDRLSVAKTVVGKSRPTTGQLKPKVPDYLVHNGVRHYWTAVEVSTVVRTPK